MGVSVDIGTAVTLRTVVKDTDGQLADPSILELQLQAPDGTIVSYTLAALEIERESLGVYSKEVVCIPDGTHQYRWYATGAVKVERGSWIYVRDSNIL